MLIYNKVIKMNNNIIIQAREKDALISYGNGDYETRFSTPIKIEQGDQLTLKNVL